MAENETSWTAEQVRNELMPSDAALAHGAPYPNLEIRAALEKMSAESGLRATPLLEVLTEQDRLQGFTTGVSFESKEGTMYIRLAANLEVADAISTLAHELGHFKNGDTTPEAIARELNDATGKTSRQSEMAADHHAVDLCKGRDTVNQLLPEYLKYQRLAQSMGVKQQTLEAEIAGDGYPLLGERLLALRDASQRHEASGKCPIKPDALMNVDLSAFAKVKGGESHAHTPSSPDSALPCVPTKQRVCIP